jgi:hypothetical protein
MRATRHTVAFACAAAALAAATPVVAQQQFEDDEFNAQWGLAAIGAQYALAKGITGMGIVVGVVEGRFDATHPEFTIPENRISDFNYIVDTSGNPRNHATMVAGIIGAARNGFGMEGVAPDVTLSNIQILNSGGGFIRPNPFTNIATGYNQAIADGIRVFNNSWGSSLQVTDATPTTAASVIAVEEGTTTEDVERFFAAMRAATAAGAVLVFANGNEAGSNPSITSGLPSLFPELQPNWITVTSTNRDGTFDTDVNKCGVGKFYCLAAPGVDIYAPVSPTPGGGPIPPNGYDTNAGTSFAAPHVTGAVALAKQMFPNAQGSELARLVLITAKDIGEAGVDNVFGWGLLSVQNLVNSLDPSDADGDDDEDGDDNGGLFVNSAFARFAAVDTLVSTLWDRSAQRILRQDGATAPTFATAMAAVPATPAMALGGPVRDDVDSAVMVSTGRSAAVWAQGLAAHASLDGSPKSSADLGGAVGGYDLFDNGTLSGGIAIAFTRSNLDTKGTGDDSSAEGWHGFAYATWQEDKWFVDGIIGGNWFGNDYKRTTIGGTSGTVLGNQGIAGYSNNDTSGLAGRLTGGHVVALGPHLVAPYAYATVIHQKTGGSTETGADIFSLDINASRLDQVEGGIGVRSSFGGLAYYGFTVAPALDLAYGRLGGDVSLPVGFDLLGNALEANAADVGRDVLRVGAQLDVIRFDELVGGFLAYDGRFQQNAQNNTFSGGILVRF